MEKYQIMSAKVDSVRGSEDTVVATVQVKKADGAMMWVTLADVGGIPSVIVSGEDMFDIMVSGSMDDETVEKINSYSTDKFGDVVLDEEYAGMENSMELHPESEEVEIIKELVRMVRA